MNQALEEQHLHLRDALPPALLFSSPRPKYLAPSPPPSASAPWGIRPRGVEVLQQFRLIAKKTGAALPAVPAIDTDAPPSALLDFLAPTPPLSKSQTIERVFALACSILSSDDVSIATGPSVKKEDGGAAAADAALLSIS